MLVGRTIHSQIHKLINSIWNKETCLNSGRSQILYLFIRRVVKLTVVIKQVHHFCFINETNLVHYLFLVYFVNFLHNLYIIIIEELNDLYSRNIVRVIKSGRMRWAGHVARMGKGEAYTGFWWGNQTERAHLGDPGVDGRTILR